MNRAELSGRIANDLNVKKTSDGVSVLNFTLAVTDPDKSDKTDFIRCSCFRQSADYLGKYAKKGTQIEVAGKIKVNTYQDRNGNNASSTEVACNYVHITEVKPKSETTVNTNDFVVDEDDLPF